MYAGLGVFCELSNPLWLLPKLRKRVDDVHSRVANFESTEAAWVASAE
jgi:hypothetical protein